MSDGEMSRETFEKFIHNLVDEKQEILAALSNASENSSNLKKYFVNALEISSKLATGQTSNSTTEKEKLQKLVFPEGIAYDYKNGNQLLKKVFF